jgi:hypothetical protein
MDGSVDAHPGSLSFGCGSAALDSMNIFLSATQMAAGKI